jgi:hypothetical protein
MDWRRRAFEPLLIADAVVQAISLLATLWIFSMRAVADGALLFSVRPEVTSLRHRCLLKDWRYLLAAEWVCCFLFQS